MGKGKDKYISFYFIIDSYFLLQIVLNLISNAYKYTLQGSIEVKFTEVKPNSSLNICPPLTTHPSITTTTLNFGSILLTVKDSGCGVSKSEIPRLFERFHRIQANKGRSHEGTGIGLALVYELVKLHGGKIFHMKTKYIYPIEKNK